MSAKSTKSTMSTRADVGKHQAGGKLGGVRWVVAMGAGGGLGMALGATVASLVRLTWAGVAEGLPTVALFGALFGLVTGLGQAIARREAIRVFPWALVSALAGGLGFVLGTKAATAISDPLSGKLIVYLSEGVGYAAFGATVGLLMGLFQMPLWRPREVSALGWMAASAVAMAAGFLVAGASAEIFTLFPGEIARELFYGALAVTIAGALQHRLTHGKG